MIRRIFLVIGVLLLAAPAIPAAAQGYGSANFIAVDDATLFRGQTFTTFGCCYLGDVVVTLSSTTVILGVAKANASGNYSLTADVPDDFELGLHTVTATGRDLFGQPLSLSTNVTVMAVGGGTAGGGGGGGNTGGGGNLARTGADPYGLLRLAAVLIGGGALLTARQRREARRRESVHALS